VRFHSRRSWRCSIPACELALPISRQFRGCNDESTWVLKASWSPTQSCCISGWLVAWLGRKHFSYVYRIFQRSVPSCADRAQPWASLCFACLQGAFEAACSRWRRPSSRYLSPEKRGLAFALYGITAICAPAIGPTLELDHRQLLLALDFLHQRPSWRFGTRLVYQLVEIRLTLAPEAAAFRSTSSDFLS